MDTVQVRCISDTLVELNIPGHNAHTATIQTVSRSPVLSHILQAAERDGPGAGTILVPAGYLVAWLSCVREVQATQEGTYKPGIHNLLVVLKVRLIMTVCVIVCLGQPA